MRLGGILHVILLTAQASRNDPTTTAPISSNCMQRICCDTPSARFLLIKQMCLRSVYCVGWVVSYQEPHSPNGRAGVKDKTGR